jgi:hypothetical protein
MKSHAIILLKLWMHMRSVYANCMPGFWGPSCELCPYNFYCDGASKYACPESALAWNGSRNCFKPRTENLTVRLVRVANFSGDFKSNPSKNQSCGCYKQVQPLFVVLDLGRKMNVAGIATKRSSEGTWIKTFMIDYSDDQKLWKGLGGLYVGNNETDLIQNNLFPIVVKTRFFKIFVLDYFLWPGFRAAFLEPMNYTEAPLCPVRVNRIVVQPSNCTYACKNGTYGNNCVSKGRPKNLPVKNLKKTVSVKPQTLKTQLHKLDNFFFIEFKEEWRGLDMALKIDSRSWVAWSKKQINIPISLQNNFFINSSFLLLPYNVSVYAHIKIVWNNRLRDFVFTSWATHGHTYQFKKNNSIGWNWGLNNVMTSTLGDSAALLSISCNRTVVDAKYALYDNYPSSQLILSKNLLPTTVFDVRSSCITQNVSHGIVWLRENTELLGVDSLLGDFVRDECRRGTTAWLLPSGPRKGQKYAVVQATCQLIT